MEIYNETMYDLLGNLPKDGNVSTQQLTVAEDEGESIYIKGLSSHLVQTEEQALHLLFEVNLQCSHVS